MLDGYVAGIEFLGEKAYEGAKKVGQVAADVKEKAGFFWNAARDKVFGIHENLSPESQINDPVNVNVPVFIFGSAPGQNNRAPRDNGGSPMSPGVWLTVDVPENVALLAFDFTLHGDPQDACLVCAAGGENIFSTQLKFMDEDAPQSVDPIDISAYTGQRVELFFGITGSTSAEIELEGIRFITIPQPTLIAVDAGDHLELKWPAAATGWMLETSDDLSTWAAVPDAANATAAQGVLTLAQPRTPGRRFFRLRRVE